jgi:hypothetical protein
MPTPNELLLSLITQARDENWEELDPFWDGIDRMPMAYGRSETIEIGLLTELKTLILGKEESGDWKDGEYVLTTIANQLTTLPNELLELVNLRWSKTGHRPSLDLSGNPLGGLPEVVCKLEQLECLNVANVGMPMV